MDTAQSSYVFVKQLQSGSYGTVIEVERGGVRYAIKESKMSSDKSRIVGAMYLTEADSLMRCDHPNILRLIEVCYGLPYTFDENDEVTKYTCDNVYLVMPLAEMSLYEYIRTDDASVPMMKRFMVQLALAAQYLHIRDVGHRDFKSPNVLIYKDPIYPEALNVKLCDFGMTKQFTHDVLNSGHVGTDRYKAPELLLGRRSYHKPVDIWALGILFFEMFNECWPFDKQAKETTETAACLEILEKIFINRGGPSRTVYAKLIGGKSTLISFDSIKKWSPKSIAALYRDNGRHIRNFEKDSVELPNFGTLEQFTDLLNGMLQLDPDIRLDIDQVLGHPFFDMVPKGEKGADIWRDLYVFKSVKPTSHILNKTKDSETRKLGIAVLSTVNVNSHALMYRCLFQGLDIFDRCLLYLELHPDVKVDPKLLAFCCFYIAAKLFLNDMVPDIPAMIPDINFTRPQMLETERLILETMLKWQVYRQTVYDLLKNKSLSPPTLWIVMTQKDDIYGSSIEKIANIYMTKVKH
jgi:serine/threonine protein kinase